MDCWFIRFLVLKESRWQVPSAGMEAGHGQNLGLVGLIIFVPNGFLFLLVRHLLLVAMPGAPSSFLLLLVRHLLLVAMRLFLVASCSY